jgi:DNA-binding NtrC family response regulator
MMCGSSLLNFMNAISPSCVPQQILLIDDDELVAGSLREYLVRGGSRVDVAQDAFCAERLMHSQQYDVVVVDPYFTGGVREDEDALLANIRGLQPSTALIILTAYSSPSLAVLAERERAAAVLTKPQSVLFLSQFVTSASGDAPRPLHIPQRMTS